MLRNGCYLRAIHKVGCTAALEDFPQEIRVLRVGGRGRDMLDRVEVVLQESTLIVQKQQRRHDDYGYLCPPQRLKVLFRKFAEKLRPDQTVEAVDQQCDLRAGLHQLRRNTKQQVLGLLHLAAKRWESQSH